MKEKLKYDNGITLVALVVTVIILMILAGMTLTLVLSQNGILNKATQAKNASINDQTATEEGLNNLYNSIAKATDGTSNLSLMDGHWNGTVNTPKMVNTGLIPVYWNGTTWTKLTQDSSQDEWTKWYDYSKQQWANAETADGSMWVWIPRYEYKINNTNHTIDINFKKIGDTTTSGYTLHPAFSTDLNSGGWDSELPGFWVAKYAAGYQNGTIGETGTTVQYSDLKYTTLTIGYNTYTTNFLGTLTANTTPISYPVFKSNTYAYNEINAGDAWLLSQKISTENMYGLKNIDSHLEKNSEWGAVAYLTQSSYGRNGTEVTANSKSLNNNIYVNNASGGTKANIYSVTGYGSNGKLDDVTASSTNNMTGVFDLSGCIWEETAGVIKSGISNINSWKNITSSTKYLTIYAENKIGDAMTETSSWNSDYAFSILNSSPIYPVPYRSGSYADTNGAGIFAFLTGYWANPSGGVGFRCVLVA